jgi:Zn-dependent M28 family amino/carboxypeptidase
LLAAFSLVATLLCFVPAAVAAAPSAAACNNRTNDTLAKLLECVTIDGLLEHQEALQEIADDNDDNRASGSSGYDDSLAYVEGRLKKAGYITTRQEFDFFKFTDLGGSVLAQTAPGTVTYVEGTDFFATPHSEDGDEVTAAVTPVDIQLGLGNTSTSGCEATDFAGFTPGNIALIQRGTCTFQIKGNNAAAAGASAIIFFNQGNTADPSRNGLPAVTLGNGYTGGIQALSTTYALGAEFAVTAGLVMRLHANVTRIPGTTENLIAESRRGDPHNVIMAGAHLDSVGEGPGINDNGSGSAGLLEVAEAIAKAKLPNKLRFAWWGAEEDGLVGSTEYVTRLVAAGGTGLADIEMYLNFDMIASPNYGLFIYDGDGSGFGLVGPDGSDDIEALFERYYAERDTPSAPTAFDGRSDYQAFILNGVPAGGLFTGAEVPKTPAQVALWGGTANVAFDPCYHSACDTIDNLDHEAFELNADAIAYVVYLYASGTEVLDN